MGLAADERNIFLYDRLEIEASVKSRVGDHRQVHLVGEEGIHDLVRLPVHDRGPGHGEFLLDLYEDIGQEIDPAASAGPDTNLPRDALCPHLDRPPRPPDGLYYVLRVL